MESDKYISVKDQAADGSLHVVVVDMHNNNTVTKKPMKAEATLMNTVDNVIALKGMFRMMFDLMKFLQVKPMG
jgi:clathrin heavy chain